MQSAVNASELKADPKIGFVVGGDSSGAALSAVMCLMTRDSKLSPPITGCLLTLVGVVHSENVPEKYRSKYLSMKQCADSPLFNSGIREAFMGKLFSDLYLNLISDNLLTKIEENYKPDPTSRLAYALLHDDHSNLPRTYFQACGMDPSRDDSIIYEEVLRESGVPTRMDMYAGLPHAFWAFLPHLDSTKKYEQDLVDGVAWLLKG